MLCDCDSAFQFEFLIEIFYSFREFCNNKFFVPSWCIGMTITFVIRKLVLKVFGLDYWAIVECSLPSFVGRLKMLFMLFRVQTCHVPAVSFIFATSRPSSQPLCISGFLQSKPFFSFFLSLLVLFLCLTLFIKGFHKNEIITEVYVCGSKRFYMIEPQWVPMG